MHHVIRGWLTWLVMFGVSYLLWCVVGDEPLWTAVAHATGYAATAPLTVLAAERLPGVRRVGAEREVKVWCRRVRVRRPWWVRGRLRESRGTVALLSPLGADALRFTAADVRGVAERAVTGRESWWVPRRSVVVEVMLEEKAGLNLVVRPRDLPTVRGWLAPAVEAA